MASSETAIVHSALWAAAGDALGWMTELGDAAALQARASVLHVVEPRRWRHLAGRSFGVRVWLPAGTYSDDTQLRLAVGRSIGSDGVFDPQVFASIELPVWLGYALGAGRGTAAAATNLSRQGSHWFSNFFVAGPQSYAGAGGNGAAMRIQPHVWAAPASSRQDGTFLLPLLKDALTTHGHRHGFCGAIFHALTLSEAIEMGTVPGPAAWRSYAETLLNIPEIVARDAVLEERWRPLWERATGQALSSAAKATADELVEDLNKLMRIDAYIEGLRHLGCFDDRYRGSGLKTAIAASLLAWLFRNRSLDKALQTAANAFGSDTDTIATMAGAILGATAAEPPSWPLQDRDYIEGQARRMADLSRGIPGDAFPYPPLATWTPPREPADIVRHAGNGLIVPGLGRARTRGEEHAVGDVTWQWLELSIGQTIFAPRRARPRGG